MVDIFRIEIFSDSGVFSPGQPVNGRLIVALPKPVKARAVVVYVVARAHTFWGETRTNGSHNTTDVYTAEFVYLNLQIPVWLPNNPTFPFVPAGMHEFPFHFTLPLNCPPSFEGIYGFIRYFCRAKIDRPWRVDDTTATAFTVMPIFDLNMIPYANRSIGRQFSEMITTCCCCDRGRIIVDASVSKCGLVPGERAVVIVNVQNLSSKYVYQIEIVLNEISRNVGQHCGYCKTRIGVRCVLRFLVACRIYPHTNGTVKQALVIPPVVPSFNMCPIIQVDYSIYVKAGVDGTFTSDVSCEIPVLIGNIPAETRVKVAEAPFNLTPPQPTVLRSDEVDIYAGRYSYANSATGGGIIGAKEDARGFAPKYMYYNQLKTKKSSSHDKEACRDERETPAYPTPSMPQPSPATNVKENYGWANNQ